MLVHEAKSPAIFILLTQLMTRLKRKIVHAELQIGRKGEEVFFLAIINVPFGSVPIPTSDSSLKKNNK